MIPPCLTLSIIRYGSRVKWSNPGNGVAPSPTPWCSSYRKGSLRVILDYGLTLLYLYIYTLLNGLVSISVVYRPVTRFTKYPGVYIEDLKSLTVFKREIDYHKTDCQLMNYSDVLVSVIQHSLSLADLTWSMLPSITVQSDTNENNVNLSDLLRRPDIMWPLW